jgi:AAA+ ATPase superfamily predicted ATPase
MENPFKFGVLNNHDYFTDRTKELQYIAQFLHSENHQILISPRRYGKSSLVQKAVRQSGPSQ